MKKWISIICIGFITFTAAYADWPIFRGNKLQSGVAEKPLPNVLAIQWKKMLPEGIEGTAAIVEGVVYIGCYDGNLYALDLKTGDERWKTTIGPTKAPPSFYKNKIYVGDEEGYFYCLDAKSGKKLWRFETQGEITCGANFSGDNVLFGSHDSTLYCLDSQGKKLWEFKTEGPVNGSPAVAGKTTFVAGCDSSLHILDIGTGKEIAAVDLGGQAGATGAVFNDKLYVGTMTNQLQAIDLKKREIVWTFERQKRSQPFYASAAVTKEFVVAGSRDRNIYGVSRAKGAEKWVFPTNGRVDASPVVAGNRVYAGSLDGNLYVIDLVRGTLVQTLTLGRGISGSPAVSDGHLVIGTVDGVLYCLGNKK